MNTVCYKLGFSQRRHNAKAAFTLLDLVICVVVFTALLLVLVPAHAGFGAGSARTLCINNLRQLGVAELMYASEYRDYLPFPNWGVSTRPGWLYANTNGVGIPDPTSAAFTNDPAAAYRSGLWFPYVRRVQTYLCPVDVESRSFPKRPNKLSSYIMNGAVCGFGSVSGSCRISDAWNPDCFLLYSPDENASGSANGMAFNDGSSFPSANEGLGRLHTPSGADILTVGGSVRFFSTQQIVREQKASGKSLAFWSPFVNGGP